MNATERDTVQLGERTVEVLYEQSMFRDRGWLRMGQVLTDEERAKAEAKGWHRLVWESREDEDENGTQWRTWRLWGFQWVDRVRDFRRICLMFSTEILEDMHADLGEFVLDALEVEAAELPERPR